jgi:protein tyrosine phosphatase (PTP) superfamily phosphohydrolase (DUF442 family)
MNDIENSLTQIDHFQFVHEHLFSSGQPSVAELKHIKEYGVTTIINLALSDAPNHLPQEDHLCLDLGLNYIQIPISLETPSDAQCLLVLDMIDHLVQEQMIWVHCTDNFTASCLMYLYRQFYMNIDMPTAQEYLHQIWEPNATWTGLIHAVTVQLQGRKSTKELQYSMIHPDHFA